MSHFKLYDTEWLVYVEVGIFKKCQYWVLRQEYPSPLFKRHKVPRRHVPMAIALFKEHPDGIRKLELNDLRYIKGETWYPQTALEHKADAE